MVHVYNCHPYASQQIVPTDQEPGLFCCGGDALFVVSAGGCRIEAFQLQREEECTLLCRFATMGKVLSIAHSEIGDYLVTIEEKSKATYLRAYTNWRYQAVEKTRVAVRMLGHFLRGSSFRAAPKEQMEIIEIPLFDPPLCFSCCQVTGDLLVGCRKSLVLFSLKKQDVNDPLSVLDFERSLIVHVPGWTPTRVCFCDGYVAIQMELEILVVKLEHFHQQLTNDNVLVSKDINTSIDIEDKGFTISKLSQPLGLQTQNMEERLTQCCFWTALMRKRLRTLPSSRSLLIRCKAKSAATSTSVSLQETVCNGKPVTGRDQVLASSVPTTRKLRRFIVLKKKKRKQIPLLFSVFPVEYSKKYETSSPQAQSCIHLLSEAHLLLRADLLDPGVRDPAEQGELEAAFRESCAQLGDCYSRFDKRDFHLALPYYKMSGLSVTDVIERNVAFSQKSKSFGKGFLFYLKHSLYEESSEELSEETAGQVLHIFSTAEPSQLPHVVCSPCMLHANHATAFTCLEKLEATFPSVIVTLTKAAIALKMENLQQYKTEMGRHAEMLQVYGFIEEPKLLLLLSREGKSIEPTALAHHLKETQEGLLVASIVALHENNKVKLGEADTFFKELCRETGDEKDGPQLLVDFWEALLVASTQEAVIQELLFKLSTAYIDRISTKENSGIKPLKTAEDLINSCSHYGLIFPWVSVITPSDFNMDHHYQEDLQKLQSLLSGPSLDPSSIFPLLEQLSDNESPGLSIHVLCATKLGDYESCIDKLLERCPQAIIPYANHELQHEKQPLWWQKVLPELCKKTKCEGNENNTFLSSLKETLLVVAMELNPLDFLNLIPDDGTAAFFLPYVLECSQKNLMT
ncbi:UNVERIFIED_CONTAM: hypothetical protein FKN15_071273 [Acipenser sinensis]